MGKVNQPILSSIIDLCLDCICMIDDGYVIETSYEGNYADLSSDQEVGIIEDLKVRPWKEVITDKFSKKSPWLYKIILDPGRSVFLDFLELPKNGLFLDVGSGWGQVSIPLSKIGHTIAMDLTKNRINILREIAKQEQSKLYYVQGNFLSFPFKENSFDLIIFNGSFEWIGIGRNQGEKIKDIQLKALKKAYTILKPGGQVYIGIENSLGLKYLLGSPDDHTGIKYITFLSELEADFKYCFQTNYNHLPAKTWSLSEYRELINTAGFEEERTYGCFPDYKLIRNMIDINEVNEYLKLYGLPTSEHNGIDGSPIDFSKELDALYRVLAINGIAQYFCPSYGLVLRKRR